MPLRDRRRSLALLMVVSAALGAGAGADVRAQEAADSPTGEELFGSYLLEARGQGMRVRYEIEGMLPGGSPVIDLGMPEALTRFTSGPIGYGVASLAYPGGVIVNLPSLVEQSGGGSDTPPYPIKQEAFYPTGPTEAVDEQPGGTAQRVVTGPLGVDAQATFPATDAPPILSVGTVRTAARSAITEGQAVSRTRVVANDVVLLGGVLTIESVVTDLVAAHDGTAGSASGGTVANGVRFLGLAASLTEDGLVLTEAPPATGALDPLQGALRDALGGAGPQLDEVLGMAGVHVSVVEPASETAEEGAASLTSSGVLVTFDYFGREQDELADLIAAIPPELRPNLGPLANPIGFFTENHFTAIGLAPAAVTAAASPPFPAFEVPAVDLPSTNPGDAGSGVEPLGDPGFSTPTPAIPAAGDRSDRPGLVAATPASVDGAIPALLVALVLLASPFLGIGGTRLADNVLAPGGTRCPTGHDRPPPGRAT